jgi:hypothetical protein
MMHPTDHKKLNKEEGPSEDVLVPLRRGKKIIMGSRRREGLEWENRGVVIGRIGEDSYMWGRQERSPEGQENWNIQWLRVGTIG